MHHADHLGEGRATSFWPSKAGEVDGAFHLSWLVATIGVDLTVDVQIMGVNGEKNLPLAPGLLPLG